MSIADGAILHPRSASLSDLRNELAASTHSGQPADSIELDTVSAGALAKTEAAGTVEKLDAAVAKIALAPEALPHAVACRVRMVALGGDELYAQILGPRMRVERDMAVQQGAKLADDPTSLRRCLKLDTPLGIRTLLLLYNAPLRTTEVACAELSGALEIVHDRQRLCKAQTVNALHSAYRSLKFEDQPPTPAVMAWTGPTDHDTAWIILPGRPKSLSREKAELYINYLRSLPSKQVSDTLHLWSALDSVTAAVAAIRRVQGRWIAPVRNGIEASKFWQQTDWAPLNVGALGYTKNSKLGYTEVTSPLLHAVRLSLNAVIASSNSKNATSTQTASAAMVTASPPTGSAPPEPGSSTTADRFRAGGGSFNLGALYPILGLGKRSGAIEALVLAAPHVGGTIAPTGTVSADSTTVWDAGIESYLASMDRLGGVGAYVQVRGALAGGNRALLDGLGVHKKHFGYASATVGVVLGSNYVLTFSRVPTGPRALVHAPIQVGLTLLRSPAR